MKAVRLTAINPTKLAACYVAVLFAIVAGLMFWPFSKPLMFLLLAWTGVFFLFALAVLASTIVLPFLAVYRQVRDGDAGTSLSPASSGVWDRDLDGPQPR